MTLKAVRVQESVSRLNQALRGYLNAEWWYVVEADVGDDPRNWPNDVVAGLLRARMEWMQTHGRAHIVARTYACIPYEGKRYCVLQVTYERVRQQLDRPVPCIPDGTQAGGTEQVDAATPARPFSPSLCAGF